MHFVQLEEESGDDELRESCLQAFEAFVQRCFREITPHVQGVSSCGVRGRQSSHPSDLGGACVHIKAIDSTPIPHQSRTSSESIRGHYP